MEIIPPKTLLCFKSPLTFFLSQLPYLKVPNAGFKKQSFLDEQQDEVQEEEEDAAEYDATRM